MQEKTKKKYDRRPKFRVVLLINGEYKKTMFKYMTKKSCFEKYRKVIEENQVIFPRKFVNYGKITPVEYQICVTKVTDNKELKNAEKNGIPLNTIGDWTILASNEFHIEETFWMYDHEDRPTMLDICKVLFDNNESGLLKRVLVINNKLVIDSDDTFDMVICKCSDDAQRLHHALYKVYSKRKYKNIVFMGKVSKVLLSEMYDLIAENTGWTRIKIKRTTTRP